MIKEEQTEKPKKKQGKSKEEKASILCKTYRFRVREKQVSSSLWQFMVQSVGNQRFVYNHFLHRMNQFWLQQITLKQELESQNKPLPEGFKTFLTRHEMEAELTVLKQTKIIKEITDECFLWQVDVDEQWSTKNLETAEKIRTLSPDQAQTGPARRNDQDSVEKHISMINDSEVAELYRVISARITQKYLS